MPNTQHPYRRVSAHSPPGIPPGVPQDYAITVPDSWALIPLEPGVREKAIGALIKRQFAGTPGAAEVKAALRRHLTDLAEAAWQTGDAGTVRGHRGDAPLGQVRHQGATRPSANVFLRRRLGAFPASAGAGEPGMTPLGETVGP